MFDVIKDKLENLLKICSFKNIKGSDGNLQEIQIKTLRNIEDALKVGQFGFNSKAPLESRGVVARIGNENIIVANEHVTSIIDITSGNTVIYNQSGHTIKIEGDTVTTTATNITNNCTSFTVNATTATINANTSFTSSTVDHNGVNIGDTHTHTQGVDSASDIQQNTGVPL